MSKLHSLLTFVKLIFSSFKINSVNEINERLIGNFSFGHMLKLKLYEPICALVDIVKYLDTI